MNDLGADPNNQSLPTQEPDPKEAERTKLHDLTLGLMDNVVGAVGAFADIFDETAVQSPEKARLVELLRAYEEVTELDYADIVSIELRPRVMRESDLGRIMAGEDQSVHISTFMIDGSIIHLNIHSKRTQINMNINNPFGRKISDCWMLVGPNAHWPPTISKLSITDSIMQTRIRTPGLKMTDPVVGSFITSKLLDNVTGLAKLDRRENLIWRPPTPQSPTSR